MWLIGAGGVGQSDPFEDRSFSSLLTGVVVNQVCGSSGGRLSPWFDAQHGHVHIECHVEEDSVFELHLA